MQLIRGSIKTQGQLKFWGTNRMDTGLSVYDVVDKKANHLNVIFHTNYYSHMLTAVVRWKSSLLITGKSNRDFRFLIVI